MRSRGSILAEIEDLDIVPAERITQKLPATFGTQVETQLPINVFAYLVGVGLLQTFKDIVNLLKVIAVVVLFFDHGRIKSGRDFYLHHVAKVFVGIEFPFAHIARIPNH